MFQAGPHTELQGDVNRHWRASGSPSQTPSASLPVLGTVMVKVLYFHSQLLGRWVIYFLRSPLNPSWCCLCKGRGLW